MRTKVLLLSLIVALSGCATTAQKEKLPPVFFPEPPALPRIQFLTSYTSSSDIEPEKSGFDKFITGGREVVRRLNKPYGVAIHAGKIYVCDTNATVTVIDLEKKTFGPLPGAQGLGKLVQPVNISIDALGNKYVADPGRGQVAVFDKNDFYVRAYGEGGDWKPVDAVMYQDELYVADSKNGEIWVFQKETGQILRRLGKHGKAADRLGIPTNIAFDNQGYLYVSDIGRFQIVKVDRDGNLRQTIGELGRSIGFFARPRGIAFDRDNRLYAVDAAFDNVQIFNKEGRLLMFFGKGGTRRGDLFLAASVSIDYDHIPYFQHLADPRFEIKALIIITSQFGDRLVNIYALGREKDRTYPTEQKILDELEKRKEKFQKKSPAQKNDASKE